MSKYLLEIGTEELPAHFADSVRNQFKKLIQFELDKNHVKYKEIICTTTPRRIVLLLEGLIDAGEDKTDYRKGPKAEVAFLDGVATKAAIGFASSLNIDVKELEIKNTNKGEFVFGKKTEKGLLTKEFLSKIVPRIIKNLQGQRFMKWGHGNFKFSRPIRWIISLYNNQILDFDVMDIEPNLTISKKTRGHRLFNNDIEIEEPSGYFAIMRNYGVISDRAERKEAILNLVNKASIDLNLHPDLNEGLLSELIDLVEKPNLILGTFDSKYLCLPAEVLCTVMKSHQRYIPFLKKGKRIDKLKITSEDILSTNFLCISNGLSTSEKIIRRGNEKVLKARFADAKFFIEADQEISCESRNKKLKDISYLKGLGNINERVQRISYISEILVRELKDRDIDLDTVLKASKFSKNDLCSEIVYEFPELQGLMGGKYLRKEGYSKDISLAVAEHYLPRFYKDDLPSTKYAAVISIADKLETLISIYVIGERPTGSSDPYALRRNLNGIIQIIWHFNFNLNIDEFIFELLTYWETKFQSLIIDKKKIYAELIEFVQQRIVSHLDEMGFDKDHIKAIVDSDSIPKRKVFNLFDLKKRIELLFNLSSTDDFDEIKNIIARVTKLANNGNLEKDIYLSNGLIDKSLFEKECENNVFMFIKDCEKLISADVWEYSDLIELFSKNISVISKLFDNEQGVLIMSDDNDIRVNRQNLLGLVRNFSLLIADFILINA